MLTLAETHVMVGGVITKDHLCKSILYLLLFVLLVGSMT